MLAATLRPALVLVAVFTALCGLAYPLLVTAVAQLAMPGPANGSVVEHEGAVVGSALIGQARTDPQQFWGRPSATTPAYNAASSSGSNLGPTNPALPALVRERVAALEHADVAAGVARRPDGDGVPVDLVTASGSGLDPDISPAGALWQVPRVARARGIEAATLRALVEARVVPRTVGIWGEPRVNVLELNLALDALYPRP